MKTLFGKSKIILSEEGIGKVSMYEMASYQSGKYQSCMLSYEFTNI